MPAGREGSSSGAHYEAMQVSTALLVRPIRSRAPSSLPVTHNQNLGQSGLLMEEGAPLAGRSGD